METNELKKLIGRECLVIDPRSKRKDYESATIMSVNVNISKMRYKDNSIYEHLSYTVELHKLTISKTRWRKEYHRSFTVSGDRIVIR